MAGSTIRNRRKPGWSRASKSLTSASESAATGDRPVWAKPIYWLGTLIVGALGLALTNWLVPQFSEAINQASQTGDPVSVHVIGASADVGSAVALPSGVELTGNDLAELNQLSASEQRAYLMSLGGTSAGGPPITVTVTGNRTDGVRITDIVPVTECSPFDAGTLVHTGGGVGGEEDSSIVLVTLDSDRPELEYRAENSEMVPYFPTKTIALKQNEQVVIVIGALVDMRACNFTFNMTVLHGGETHTQTITDDGNPFFRSPLVDDKKFQNVYLGGIICNKVVKIDGYWGLDPNPCGPGNEGPYYGG